MGRRAKPAKVKAEAKRPLAREAPKQDAPGIHELEKRLAEALEQQAATAEILKVISSAPTDIQPVLDAVAESAARLCGATDVVIRQLDGDVLRLVAHIGPVPVLPGADPTISRRTFAGRAILERRTIHIHNVLEPHVRKEYPDARFLREPGHFRTLLCAPLLREDTAIGAIVIRGQEIHPFSDKQIKLLETFAAQAVIAIENVRLFNETKEALEQQTVTAEILRVISSSPTDTQPVFDAIVKSGVHLFGGMNVSLRLVKGGQTETVASTLSLRDHGPIAYPVGDDRNPSSRAILRREVVQIPDIFAEDWLGESVKQRARVRGHSAALVAPMLRGNEAIGAIAVTRATPGPFTDKQIALLKTFADQAVIAIENVRLFNETKEALERQTATAEVLQVISGSPTDVQPVLDAVAERAARLCEASNASIDLLEGDVLRRASSHGDVTFLRNETFPLDRGVMTARAVLERRAIHVHDISAERSEYPLSWELAQRYGHRAILVAPLMKEGKAIGTIVLRRRESRPFSEKQIALIQTFADQAVIAIENVRLFNETKESLEQQTVISEILRVISSSPTDTQPVFDAIVKSGVHLFGGMNVGLRLVKGNHTELVASTLPVHETGGVSPISLDSERFMPSSQAILRREVVHVPDAFAEEWVGTKFRERAQQRGFRAILAAPMLRENNAIGTINVSRAAPGPFTDKQIALLKTFADQAVIAIENVRLFKELQARNAEITEALEQQTATSEILRVISSTPTDVTPVLDTVAHRAAQLCEANDARVYVVHGDELRYVAGFGELEGALLNLPLTRSLVTGRAVVDRSVVHIEDLAAVLDDFPDARGPQQAHGARTLLAVPLMRENRAFGALLLLRKQVRPFTEKQIALVRTFADQSAIAIENVRLFNEIQDKSRQLEVASRHKSQFLANMSHELRTPLNAILGYTELILDGIYGDVSTKVRDVMGRVDKSGRHLLGLINDVLDLSKIEAGQLTLSLADYSLADVVQTVFTAVESLAAEKKLALKVAAASDLPRGRGDDRRLTQVLLNLVGNAIKFTEAGEVRLEARCSDGAFVVSVADTGPGISKADQQRIFEEFQQVDDSATRKKGGTGLGLAIAKRIIELHGGRIQVESAPGRGSTFTVTLPVRVERQAGPS